MRFFLALSLFSVLGMAPIFSWAQEEQTTSSQSQPPLAETAGEKVEQVTNQAIAAYRQAGASAQISRAVNSATVLLHYSSFDLVLPSKMGATIAWHKDGNVLYELEYLSSSVSAPYVVSDLASMSETRVSLLKRNFSSGGTFNWYWGGSYNASNVHVSQALMNNNPGASDMLDVSTLGLSFGLGNRWVFKENFSVGVDWFTWSQPLFILKKEAAYLDSASNENDRDKVDTILKVIGYFPRWSAFKVSVGYSF